MAVQTREAAATLLARRNRQAAKVEADTRRLELARETLRETERRLWASLPDGYMLSLNSDGPWELVEPRG